ncbi:MGDG synthase family glycosyltransferase [Hazenella coriacea]|uniref:Processive 1,2-diacylglycerol beta-glucosyltransferase n=1 Tax=Hazenella coriacea TaxID=1179467 RepID=A0A4R3KZU6_9BACL|nr:glycosyltransferase [Hazenella coriacea]TCS92343.1 processive 1,2-diacylglycerol beta-glucosyltransferase [Hazenella coriacea]
MGFGTGHNAVAKTLKCHFEQLPGVTAKVVDLLELIPQTFHPLLQSGYQGMLNKFPFFYHYLYDWTHQSRVIRYVSSELIANMGWTIRKKLNALFRQVQPTRIVTTHPFGLLMAPSKWAEVPSIGVVTDYELHPMWLARVPNVLCVPKKLLGKNEWGRIEWKTGLKVVETGLPIHPHFYEAVAKEEARLQLGLQQQRPVVLIMGGGTGLGPLENLVEAVRASKHIQFVVLTGKNKDLYERLSQEIHPHIRVESFRTDIPVWMSAADLLVTKPGGVTISEAIAKRLPMLLFEAFPGQEEANQQYLLHHRVGMITHPSTIRFQIENFFSPYFQKDRLCGSFEELSSEESAQHIVNITMKAKRPILQTL